MQKNRQNRFLLVLRFASALLFICALLAGCAARSDTDALSDEDAPSETAATAEATTAQTVQRTVIPLRPIQELLPDTDAFTALFVSVGKADACILRFGDAVVLIDTGSESSVPQLIAGLNALNVTKIDAVFITHSHSDHIGGLSALAANYDISLVYSPSYSEANKDGEGRIVKRAEKLHLNHIELRAGDSVPVADGVSFSVLAPLTLNEENDNDNSLVLQFAYGGKAFLFTGDMQDSEEQALIASGVSLKADVLKVGNHGNPDATGDVFAALVSPSVAVIPTDTTENADSANPRVFAALPGADIYVTQDFPIGILLSLDSSGSVVISNPARESPALDIAIESADVKHQSVTITNSATADADLSGCVVFCAETGAALRFPDGAILPAGGSLIIGEGNPLTFPDEDKPLRRKKENTVQFFDRSGSLVSELTN